MGDGAYDRKVGDRVYMLLVHEVTGEEKKRWGTVTRDDILFHDYTDVAFDDSPNWTHPILGYYLHDE